MRVMLFVKKFDFVYSYILHVFTYYFILFILCTIPQFSELFLIERNSTVPFTRNVVSRIRDVLIRIHFRGSVLLDSGSGSCSFLQWLSRHQQKISFFPTWFCLLLSVGTFTSVFKDNKFIKSHKTVEIKGFLCFLTDGSRSGSYQ